MSRPLLLDLFSGAGGCAKGYSDAGFDVIGVDIAPQKHYPYDFYQANALDVLNMLLADDGHGLWHGYALDDFAVIHASPVCKAYSFASLFHPGTKEKHSNFIPDVRHRLIASSKPYIIENVAGAPLLKSICLCGAMFGLRTYRHRYFESNMLLFQPEHPRHTLKAAGPGAIAKPDEMWCIGGHFGQKDDAQRAMEIDWMTKVDEIAQAIPPSYTHWIGLQLMDIIEREVNA